MENEIWNDIEGYEGLYQVSNLGRVKSLNYNRTGNEQILKPSKKANGYLKVILCKNGKLKHLTIHRLVARAFIPNPNNLPHVNHKDENKENNRVDNLEWCDAKYNNNYGTRNERHGKHMLGVLVNRKDLSKKVVCVETGRIYPSSCEASRQTGVDQGHISGCCSGKRKTTGGFHWKYAE